MDKQSKKEKKLKKTLARNDMRKLLVGEKIVENGITFERLKNGDGVFTVSIMVDGQRIHRVVGRESDGTTMTQVKEFIAKVRTDAKHDRLALPRGRKVALSFRDAAEKYLVRLPEEGGKDLKAKDQRLRLHLVPFFGDKPLSKITSFDIERYKHKRLGEASLRGGDRVSAKVKAGGAVVSSKPRKSSPGTINRELAVLSHLFNKAVEWGWLAASPSKIKRLKEGSGRITYLTVEQVNRLVECAKESDNPHIHPFIIVAVATSMRLMEVLSIRKDNIDVAKRTIYIPKAKAGQREQPITQHLADFLTGMTVASDPDVPWLFPSETSASGYVVDIRKPFIRAVEEAGLDPTLVVPHTLRHTAITHLVQAGVDLPTVKRISGHKTLAMVEKYSHQSGEHISAAMDTLQKRLKLA